MAAGGQEAKNLARIINCDYKMSFIVCYPRRCSTGRGVVLFIMAEQEQSYG
jgi:hypothetical protein